MGSYGWWTLAVHGTYLIPQYLHLGLLLFKHFKKLILSIWVIFVSSNGMNRLLTWTVIFENLLRLVCLICIGLSSCTLAFEVLRLRSNINSEILKHLCIGFDDFLFLLCLMLLHMFRHAISWHTRCVHVRTSRCSILCV